MIDHVVVDVEIAHTIEETPGGWDATDRLGIGVACLFEHQTQRMRIYGPDDVELLRARLLKADRISGFNTWRFDLPLIWGFSRQTWDAACQKEPGAGLEAIGVCSTLRPKSDDLLRRIWQALNLNPDKFEPRTHGGWGLDAVAGATLGVGKIGHGAMAPKWFQLGQIQKVANYCCDDVALERDLVEFVEKHGYILRSRGALDVHRLQLPPWKPEATLRSTRDGAPT